MADISQTQETSKCENCGNVYRVELVVESEDWNDFGFSYCPFCGHETDDIAEYHQRIQKRQKERRVCNADKD